MFIDLTPEQHALRLKCRDYFQALMTPELKARMRGAEGGDEYRDLIRKKEYLRRADESCRTVLHQCRAAGGYLGPLPY